MGAGKAVENPSLRSESSTSYTDPNLFFETTEKLCFLQLSDLYRITFFNKYIPSLMVSFGC